MFIVKANGGYDTIAAIDFDVVLCHLSVVVDLESNNDVRVTDCHEVEGIEPRFPLLLVFAHIYIVLLRFAVRFLLDAQTSNLCYFELILIFNFLLFVKGDMALPNTALLAKARLGLVPSIVCICMKKTQNKWV